MPARTRKGGLLVSPRGETRFGEFGVSPWLLAGNGCETNKGTEDGHGPLGSEVPRAQGFIYGLAMPAGAVSGKVVDRHRLNWFRQGETQNTAVKIPFCLNGALDVVGVPKTVALVRKCDITNGNMIVA